MRWGKVEAHEKRRFAVLWRGASSLTMLREGPHRPPPRDRRHPDQDQESEITRYSSISPHKYHPIIISIPPLVIPFVATCTQWPGLVLLQ